MMKGIHKICRPALVMSALLIHFLSYSQNGIDEKFISYSRMLSPEKLYLHTDREVYNIGDTIWFKGYLKNASSLAEYKECNYIYVELITSKWEKNFSSYGSEQVSRTRSRVKVKRNDNGTFTGYLPLKDDNNTGLATLRAYSYWMLNSEPELLFSKNIELFNPMKDEFAAMLKEAGYSDQLGYDEFGLENPFRKALFKKKKKEETDIDLQFLPESGRYLAGVPSVVAVKALNTQGLGVKVSGKVFADGVPVSEFETNELGMGKVVVTVPQETRKLTATAETAVENFEFESDFPLPEKAGVVINVLPDLKGAAVFVSSAELELPDSTFVIIYDKSEIALCSPYAESLKGRYVKYTDLEPGINMVAVIDQDGNVYAQRPFFVFPYDRKRVTADFDKDSYAQREKVSLDITLADGNGTPLEGDFSVAVTDEEYAPYSAAGHTIESYMLMGSELRGMIENPQYYFTDTVPEAVRLRDIDLLMMSQGWRYYDLEAIAKGRTRMPKYGKEYTQSLSGYVSGPLGKSKSSTLCFAAPSINYFQIADLDSTAYFALNGLDFPEGTSFLVGAQGRKKAFKKWYLPILNPEYFAADFQYPEYLKNTGYSESYGDYVRKSYSVVDGTLSYTLMPSRIVAEKEVSPYPHDSFKPGQYRGEKQLEPYKDLDVVTYIATTCPGVRLDGNALVCRIMGAGGRMASAPRWQSINIYLNGFPATQGEIEPYMVSDLEAFAYVTGADAAKYETMMTSPEYWLRTRSVVMLKTRWPAHAAPNVTADKPLGWQTPAKFYTPKYENAADRKRFEPMRSTLHWEPELDVNGGKAHIDFYSSDHQVPYTIIIEGITSDGRPVHFRKSTR